MRWIVCCLLVACACGGRTASDGDDGGGTTTSPGESDAGSEDADGSSDDDGGAACEEWANVDPTGPELDIRVTNDADEAIFLASALPCDLSYFLVESDAGFFSNTGGCTHVCEQESCGACPPVCIAPFLIRIEPGGHYDMSWHGAYYEAADLPTECAANEDCAGACFVFKPAPSGEYTISIAAYGSQAVCGNGDCECLANPDGWCETDLVLESDPDYEAELAVPYPEVSAIEFVLP